MSMTDRIIKSNDLNYRKITLTPQIVNDYNGSRKPSVYAQILSSSRTKSRATSGTKLSLNDEENDINELD